MEKVDLEADEVIIPDGKARTLCGPCARGVHTKCSGISCQCDHFNHTS
jgi:hypothetical protein